MDKPAIIVAIDERVDAGDAAFVVVASARPLSEAREYIQEIDGVWLVTEKPPYVYRDVKIYYSLAYIRDDGFAFQNVTGI
ncbi:MAG: hypothetical protein OSB00_15035 [Sphingomonas bacterium]|nr:hypothetical protein [Sphingomonas bacterium]